MKKQEVLQKAYGLLHDIYANNFKIDDWTQNEINELFDNHEFYEVYEGNVDIPEFKIFDELDTDTDINWWNENRKRVNTVIRMVNNWQIKDRFEEYNGKLILAHVDLLRREYPEHETRGLSDWQHEILDDVESFVKNKLS